MRIILVSMFAMLVIGCSGSGGGGGPGGTVNIAVTSLKGNTYYMPTSPNYKGTSDTLMVFEIFNTTNASLVTSCEVRIIRKKRQGPAASPA